VGCGAAGSAVPPGSFGVFSIATCLKTPARSCFDAAGFTRCKILVTSPEVAGLAVAGFEGVGFKGAGTADAAAGEAKLGGADAIGGSLGSAEGTGAPVGVPADWRSSEASRSVSFDG
jgi:hypothetical protein